MYKLMIVDDDKIIRQSIIELIDWEKSPFVLTGEGYDGADALSKIRANPPDLVITDIYMPVMDGIELIETVKREFQDIIFLVLSNYDEYTYVRSAMKIGAIDYLLKFELSRDGIEGLLNSVRKRLDTQLLCNEIEKKRLPQKKSEGGRESVQGLPIHGILIGAVSPVISGEVKSYLADLPKKLTHCCDHILFSNEYEEHYLFVYYDPGVSVGEVKMELFSSINWENPLKNAKYMIAVSNFIENEQQLSGSCECCHKMLDCSFYDCDIHLIMERNFTPFYRAASLESYLSQIPEIIRKLQSNSREEATETLRRLLLRLAKDHLEPGQAIRVLEHLTHEINEFAVTFEVELPEYFEEGLLPGDYFSNCWNISEVEEAFDRLVGECHFREDCNQQISNEITQNAIRFIGDHFNRQICLQDVADYVSVNKNHLCRLLKKHAGTSFNQLLNQMRIRHSMQLLEFTELSMEAVAYTAGYSDYHYFKKVFVKSTGVFPSEYRKTKQK